MAVDVALTWCGQVFQMADLARIHLQGGYIDQGGNVLNHLAARRGDGMRPLLRVVFVADGALRWEEVE